MEDKDLIIAKYKRRSRIMSVLTGVMTFLTFIFFVYAFVQKGFADEFRLEAERSIVMAKQCQREAELQHQAAEAAAEQARLAQQQAEAALQKALKK